MNSYIFSLQEKENSKIFLKDLRILEKNNAFFLDSDIEEIKNIKIQKHSGSIHTKDLKFCFSFNNEVFIKEVTRIEAGVFKII